MNYLKAFKNTIILLSISFNAIADLKPYTAIYDVYTKGFHVGEATQTLTKADQNWLIKLHTEAKGFASFLQRKPIIQEHYFTLIDQKPLLLSAKSDSGKSGKNAKKSAYYDQATKQLYIKDGDKSKKLPMNQALTSYLALPLTASSMQNDQALELSLYEKGKVVQKIMSYQGLKNGFITINVGSKNSKKQLRYLFKAENKHIPFRIEKIKNGKIKAYMELNHFSH